MTGKEIVQALRCRARHEKAMNEGCKKCPYWATENLEEWQKLCGWASCKVYQIISDAADAIERLTAENAALREKQRWIPVTERMPNTIPCNAGTEYSEAVIVWTTGNKAMIAVWDGIDFICPTDFWEAWGEEITNWMPLPEVPEGEL